MKIALLIAIAAVSPSALAGDIYKCQDATGKIEFRDWPCNVGHTMQKLEVTPNTIGTMTLEEVRAKSAEFKARQQARRDAENAATERARQQQRAFQDATELQRAIRDRGADAAQPQYFDYYAGQQRPLTAPVQRAPPSPPRVPAMPTAPPRPLSGA